MIFSCGIHILPAHDFLLEVVYILGVLLVNPRRELEWLISPICASTDVRQGIAVRDFEKIDNETLQRYWAYLKLVADSQVDNWLRQRIDASDLVQQSMLDAVARRDQFRGSTEGELLAWLRTILSNNLIDAFRHYGRAKRDAARILSLEDEISRSFRRIDALVTDSTSSPSQKAVRNEQLLRLPVALDGLPAAQREAIVLHHLQGRTLSETARRLDRSETAVGGLLHRGLKRLHELLGE